MLNKWKLKNKLLVYSITLVLISLIMFIFFEVYVEKLLYKEKEEQLRNVLFAVTSTVDLYQQLINKGEMTVDDAKAKLAGAYKGIRYGDNKSNYVFIINYDGFFEMHPDPSLDKTSAMQFKDAEGKDIGALFMSVKGEPSNLKYVYYNYKFQNKGYIPKVTLIRAIPEWNWIIGTGIPLKEMRESIF